MYHDGVTFAAGNGHRQNVPFTDHYKSTMYDRQDLSYTGVSQGWNAKGSFFISFIKIPGFWR